MPLKPCFSDFKLHLTFQYLIALWFQCSDTFWKVVWDNVHDSDNLCSVLRFSCFSYSRISAFYLSLIHTPLHFQLPAVRLALTSQRFNSDRACEVMADWTCQGEQRKKAVKAAPQFSVYNSNAIYNAIRMTSCFSNLMFWDKMWEWKRILIEWQWGYLEIPLSIEVDCSTSAAVVKGLTFWKPNCFF